METLYLLIPMSILMVFGIIAILFYAVQTGQFDDLEGQGESVLMDDDRISEKSI